MERLTSSNKEIPTLTADNETYWLKVYFKLKEYEDLEEQGLLLKLPCKVETHVYEVAGVVDWDTGEEFDTSIKTLFGVSMVENFGKTIFLTKAEAEKALEEMEK